MKIHFKSMGLALLASAALGLVACGGEKETTAPELTLGQSEVASMATIEGNVLYRERIMLPPNAEVEVQLEDISRADAMATVMESVMFRAQGGPPYPFVIEYDPARIDERMRYALRARITVDGQLRFTNTEYIDPFSGNPVQVMVQGMAQAQQSEKPAAGEGVTAVDEVTEESPGSGDAEHNDGGMVWVLDTLGGVAAPLGADGRSADLQLNAGDSSAGGFSGCNRYNGAFSTKGTSLRGTPLKFGPMASTMRFCDEGNELEQSYLKALGRVEAYRMEGGNLILLAGGKAVATFRPR